MTILETLKEDLKKAMLHKDEDKKNIVRIILGDFQTLQKSEQNKITDENNLILNVLISLQKTYTEFNKKTNSDNTYNIDYINSLLPDEYVKYSDYDMKNIVKQLVEEYKKEGKNIKMLIRDIKQREDANKFDTKEVALYINAL